MVKNFALWNDLILIKFKHLAIMLDFLLLYVHQYDIINLCDVVTRKLYKDKSGKCNVLVFK